MIYRACSVGAERGMVKPEQAVEIRRHCKIVQNRGYAEQAESDRMDYTAVLSRQLTAELDSPWDLWVGLDVEPVRELATGRQRTAGVPGR